MLRAMHWLWTGSVQLFTVFGIRVRAHASLIVIGALVLLLGWSGGDTFFNRMASVLSLFVIVLLHEFGHCFAARWTGGSADEILLTPLGGLAMAYARRRPWPTFVTVAGGPLVNVIICLVCGIGLYLTMGQWLFWPSQFGLALGRLPASPLTSIAPYLFWIYSISYFLLLFNLLPVFPLDGGQLLQSILWPKLGYHQSMLMTVNIGLAGSVLMIMAGVASLGSLVGGVLLIVIAINCLLNCLQMKRMLVAQGPWGFSEEDAAGFDAGSSRRSSSTRGDHEKNLRQRRRLETQAKKEQEQIDHILAKVSAQGLQSLNWMEKRALKKATQRQRQRDAELSRLRQKTQ
ncbi:MAG: site-2 protease family protein [Phycisphaerales bacterium]|nr:site-2 protease family protein [Phycisphaerales bacterium]